MSDASARGQSGCCCGPARPTGAAAPAAASAPESRMTDSPPDLLALPGGEFAMGDAHGDGDLDDGEAPRHAVLLSPFSIGARTVTNAEFAAFTAATGYVTTAEHFGSSAVFHLLLGPESRVLGRDPQIPWWCEVAGAHWAAPEGGGSDIADRWDHPVVHVSHADALAYCAWSSTRLPSEAEWEFAARGGLNGRRYPWGNRLLGDGGTPNESVWPCNIWQGEFPTRNTAADGYSGTAPADAYAPNGYGLYNTVGNVWEWCADYFDPAYYPRSPEQDPPGPAEGQRRVMRGGSFLCHDSYCNRYRVAARSSNTPESSASNIGFRVAR
ncbi:formylglycine-generating enzyme family protein [Brevibacterium sp. 50QC2O2]|uniref:formylglycine-generating enzyme family protein n=1 Tax=Brevibacterium sp. 50QC2O2 TaxID=2968459 RepID=UPI003593E2B5